MVREYAFISFFRAIAALWVLAAHCMIWGGWYGLPLPSAKIAVDLFMMISGYLMAANAFARHADEPLSERSNRLRFYLRRFFRLAPAYYVSLAVAALGSGWFLEGYVQWQQLNPAPWAGTVVYDPTRVAFDAMNLFMHVTFLFGLHPSYAFSTFLPDWSLSLEMQFYLCFPLLFLFMHRRNFVRRAFWIGFVSMFIGLAINKFARFPEPSLLFLKLQFFGGMLVAYILHRAQTRRERIGALLCGLFLVTVWAKYGGERIVPPLLFVAIIGLGQAEMRTRLPRWLNTVLRSRLVRFGSDASYSVYLFHGFFISAAGLIVAGTPSLRALDPALRVAATFGFVLVGSYAVAFMVYRLVELPGIRFGKRFIERRLPRRAGVPAAPLPGA